MWNPKIWGKIIETNCNENGRKLIMKLNQKMESYREIVTKFKQELWNGITQEKGNVLMNEESEDLGKTIETKIANQERIENENDREEKKMKVRKLNFLKKMQRKISFKVDTKFALIPC